MRNISPAGAVAALALALGAALPAVSGAPAPDPFDSLTAEHPRVRAAAQVQEAETPGLMRMPGVLGTAVGVEESGQATLVVYVDRDSPGRGQLVRSLPPQIRGVGLRVEETEAFRAYGNTGHQLPPVQLGTSGGWGYDLANGYCCGGTLGSLVQVNGVQYILSNYHVLESDIVAGGNGIIATTGSPVIQPGLIDAGCNSASTLAVGALVRLSSLPGSNVDAAVAQALPGMVDSSGSILGIGPISRSTAAAKLRQSVKKSGRTTGVTASKVSGLNATIKVTYANECAGAAAFTHTFTGQIVVANNHSTFLISGDSGSLLVENTAVNPRAIGLLFAGSSTSAIANPITQVLQFVGAKLGGTAAMVGN